MIHKVHSPSKSPLWVHKINLSTILANREFSIILYERSLLVHFAGIIANQIMSDIHFDRHTATSSVFVVAVTLVFYRVLCVIIFYRLKAWKIERCIQDDAFVGSKLH